LVSRTIEILLAGRMDLGNMDLGKMDLHLAVMTGKEEIRP
jgi:hypothetical protein